MTKPRRMLLGAAAVFAAAAASGTAGASGKALLIIRDGSVRAVEVAEITATRLRVRDGDGSSWSTVPRDRCVALLNPEAAIEPRREGWLRLADGQRFPGQALSAARPSDDMLAWNQSTWLGRLEVPLERIESVTFLPDAVLPAPGDADVLRLANGDRLEGFVTALGDPISVEIANGEPGVTQPVDLPLGRVAAVRLVTPPRPAVGRRLWLTDGTVLDVGELQLGQDGVFRLEELPFLTDERVRRLEMRSVAAVLFAPGRLVPLASMSPARVEGPPTRYTLPAPAALDELAPLGLARVELRGPLRVQYVLPEGATFLRAEAELPVLSRAWGDCELLVRDEGRVVFASRLNAESPRAEISVELTGSLLTVEVTEGAAGPIQDRVVLHRALLLK